MLSSINNNSAINQSQALTQRHMQALSSGKRINSAADDPAGLALADAMTSQLNGRQVAGNNITAGLSITDIAGSSLSQVTENLQRMRELTIQAGNATLNDSDRQSIQEEINGITKTLDTISGTAQFNGKNLLDGNFSGQQLQVGPNSGDTQSLSFDSVSATDLGVSGVDITSAANVPTALDAIDNALKSVSTQQSNIGGIAAGLNTSLSNLNDSYVQLAASRSRIQDSDFAKTTSELNKSNTQNQVAIYAHKLYQDVQKASTLGLLP